MRRARAGVVRFPNICGRRGQLWALGGDSSTRACWATARGRRTCGARGCWRRRSFRRYSSAGAVSGRAGYERRMSVVVVLGSSTAAFWAVPDADHLSGRSDCGNYSPERRRDTQPALTSAGSLKKPLTSAGRRVRPLQDTARDRCGPKEERSC